MNEGKKIMFSINEYDSDGDIYEKGVYLYFGVARIRIAGDAEELNEFEKEIKKIITEIRDNYSEYKMEKGNKEARWKDD